MNAICMHKGNIYHAEDARIKKTLASRIIPTPDGEHAIFALCSHEGELYYGGTAEEIKMASDAKFVSSRQGWIQALCSHKGRLYDAGEYAGIFGTLENRKIIYIDGTVTAMCSLDDELVRKFIV